MEKAMMERFERNFPALTAQEQQMLTNKHVLILGCGGLGGYLCEYMTRLGVGRITAVDPDCFEKSNLNRQLLSSEETLGCSKALTAMQRARSINPGLRFVAEQTAFDAATAQRLLADVDIVLDGLDSAADRLLMEDACAKAGVKIVHGAVHGWMAQVAVVLPGSGMLHRLYGAATAGDGDKACLVFTPAYCAALQATEAAKLLVGRESSLEGRLLMTDLLSMDTNIITL